MKTHREQILTDHSLRCTSLEIDLDLHCPWRNLNRVQSQILIQVKKLVSQGIFCTVSQLVEILHQIERLRFAAYDFREHFYILIQTGNFLSRTTSKFPSSHFFRP
eukprot:UN21108